MMNTRLSIIMLLATLSVTIFTHQDAYGQDRVERYAAQLNVPAPETGARANVSYESDVEMWLVRYGLKKGKVNGYRICIFSDYNQDARSKSRGALYAFQQHFPGISGEIIYNAPTWKVVVGHCLTLTEATILLGKVRQSVSANAFLFREEFDASKALKGFAAAGEEMADGNEGATL